MAWIPMMSVKNAELRRIKRVTVIMSALGCPELRLPVFKHTKHK